MKRYYLAIDIGASSGRHILGSLENGILCVEEIYRFENRIMNIEEALCWDLNGLFEEIIFGMKKCKEIGKIPLSVGIDTWGVDFVLLDSENQVIGHTVAYRDDRTKGMDVKVYDIISEDNLYSRTGIQKQIFNSIYQLMSVKENKIEYMNRAESFLMIPDYFHFLLSGEKYCEYTNATTTQMMNPITKNWDYDLIDMLGFPRKIFGEIKKPGTLIGNLTKEMQSIIGYNCKLILPASHDTASAVMAVPTNDENTLYVSSGTWSLMGTEINQADCSEQSQKMNFTNEGGYDDRFRFLKNIMGLWMIQSVKKEIGKAHSFGDICRLASEQSISAIVNCNDNRFLSPVNMTREIQNACRETNQPIPMTIAEVAAVIYNSLAIYYRDTSLELEKATNVSYDKIYVVGGGANADYLNKRTAQITGKTVIAGPAEATAIGNLMAQMISTQTFKNITEARECLMKSFDIEVYK